jgi:hypothetical protein
VTELLTVMTAVIHFKLHFWSLQERCTQKCTHCEWFLVDLQNQNCLDALFLDMVERVEIQQYVYLLLVVVS